MTNYGIDPLRWNLKWINGNICYRLHPKVDIAAETRRRIEETRRESLLENCEDFDEEPDCTEFTESSDNDYDDDDDDDDGKIRATLHVPDCYLGRICGQQHSRRKEIERDTRTSIKIPEKGSNDDIEIMGDSEEAVAECMARLRALVDNARSHDAFTHFVSIPLAYENVKRNLKEFQCQALAAVPALSEKLFVRPKKLHLTVCCLCLRSKTEVDQAIRVLSECQHLIDTHIREPLHINIRGLEIMNDDPEAVNVLYAKIQEQGQSHAGRLQSLCDGILERFRETGMVKINQVMDREHLKLHMTVINSKFADNPNTVENSRLGGQNYKKTYDNVKTFTAKKLLQNLGEQDFGTVQLERVELNIISQTEPKTGYYCAVAKLDLPQK